MPTINERAAIAADASTATATLRELVMDSSPKVREAVANNPTTPSDLLDALARDKAPAVRTAVAENPSPQARTVALAAPDVATRGRAAQRDDLGREDIDILLNDVSHTVRQRLAEVVADQDAVAALVRDSHPAVRSALLFNPELSDVDIEALTNDRIAAVRSAAAASRRVHPNTLTRLSMDHSAQVRWSVLVNNPERLDLARTIAEDADEMNASQAKAQLENPRQFTAYLGDIPLIS